MKWKPLGKCADCGKPIPSRRTRCRTCNAKHNLHAKAHVAQVASLPSHTEKQAKKHLDLLMYSFALWTLNYVIAMTHPLLDQNFGFILTAEMVILVAYLSLKKHFKRLVTKGARGKGSPTRKSQSST